MPFAAVVLDDLGGTPAFRNGNNFLNSIVCKSRHYLTNFFVCVQHPYQCPRALRSQCSHVMLFATKDKKLLEELAKENCSHLAPDQFVQMFQHATADPHSFMLCDFKKNEVRKNFDEVLKFSQTKSVPITNGQTQESKVKEEDGAERDDYTPPLWCHPSLGRQRGAALHCKGEWWLRNARVCVRTMAHVMVCVCWSMVVPVISMPLLTSSPHLLIFMHCAQSCGPLRPARGCSARQRATAEPCTTIQY